MPHLSPMNWLLMPALFWLSLLLTISLFWWLQSPKLAPQPPFTPSQTPMKWKWAK